MVTTTTFSPVKGAQAARAAIDLAVAYANAAAAKYAAGAVPGRWKAARLNGAGSTPAAAPAATRSAPAEPVARSGINWDCVATAEEGGNWSFHGTVYSSALGMLNQAIRENTDPSTAARIVAGEGTRAEQVAVAESIVRKHGFRHSWGVLTVEKCG